MERVSTYQLAVLIVLFELGSTPLFALGSKAKQDSWIAMSLGGAAGLLLLLLFLQLQRREPELSLIGMLRKYLGSFAGTLAGWVYVFYFAYESMRNVRDFGELTQMALLGSTPLYVVSTVVMLIAFYAVASGIETFARVSEVILPIVVLSYMLLILLILGSDLIHLDQLEPVLENGWTPVLRAAFPDIVSFPFGQTVLFLMLWSLLDKKTGMRRVSFWAYGSVAVFLILMNALNLMILGPVLVENSTLPLLQSVQLIQIADILERLDVLVSLLIFFGLFVKLTLFYWGAAQAAALLSRTKRSVWVVVLGLAIFGSSFLEPSYTYHVWLGLEVSVKLFPLVQVVLPLLLWMTVKLRRMPASPPP
ncbi:GerAB/ArcD/ProY family transporter [Paenibacillus caseinilyticus]|uniref:Spore germination protein n=1 Tax=Paenibacillus mucilaginosus K02 TaxID=997761 RepID=I0BP31_9BACL|nr:endospore germination permease [Paenibacillus mucilaginosus]AFH64128.1 spore germination protein [Paenibacillus mucilaginosus K02]